MAHAPQTDAGDDGARPRRPSARRIHPTRRCLPRRRAQLRRRASAGAARRARPLSSPRSRPSAEGHPLRVKLHCGRGLPTHRNRRLGAAGPEPEARPTLGASSAMGWPASMCVTAVGCVHEPMVTGGGNASAVGLSTTFRWVLHDAPTRQHRTPCAAPTMRVRPNDVMRQRHLRRVRVPVQSALRPARHHPQTGLRGCCEPRRCRSG